MKHIKKFESLSTEITEDELISKFENVLKNEPDTDKQIVEMGNIYREYVTGNESYKKIWNKYFRQWAKNTSPYERDIARERKSREKHEEYEKNAQNSRKYRRRYINDDYPRKKRY